MDWNEMQRRLAAPFPIAAISWRAGSVSRDKKRAQALPYAEPRVYEDRLNAVLGPDWSCRFRIWGDQRLICGLTVRVGGDAGEVREVTRTSTGEFDGGDKIAQGTVAEAQAFKRACSKFGLGRYLYDVPITWVGYDEGSCRLTETPTLPERFHPRAEPVSAQRAKPTERLTAHRASLLHKELGRLSTIASREHHALAGEAFSRTVDGFTGLAEDEALLVLNHARSVHAQRKRRGHGNPERQGGKQRLRA